MDTTQADLYALLKEQEFRCALTGRKLTPEASSLDHKTPMARGGTNDRDNLQWLSEGVNAAKGNMSNEEFIAMCREVIAHTEGEAQ